VDVKLDRQQWALVDDPSLFSDAVGEDEGEGPAHQPCVCDACSCACSCRIWVVCNHGVTWLDWLKSAGCLAESCSRRL
jgi:hypothetical protein